MGKVWDLFRNLLRGRENYDASTYQDFRRQQNTRDFERRRKQEETTIRRLKGRQTRLEMMLAEVRHAQRTPRVSSIRIDDILGFPTKKFTKKRRSR